MKTLSLAQHLQQVKIGELTNVPDISVLNFLILINQIFATNLAGKSSITDYGTVEKLGEKLAAKR